ncbi:hypothetical protein ACIOML_22295 [Streptomyces anulatus]
MTAELGRTQRAGGRGDGEDEGCLGGSGGVASEVGLEEGAGGCAAEGSAELVGGVEDARCRADQGRLQCLGGDAGERSGDQPDLDTEHEE